MEAKQSDIDTSQSIVGSSSSNANPATAPTQAKHFDGPGSNPAKKKTRRKKKQVQVEVNNQFLVENKAPPSILNCYIFKNLLDEYSDQEGLPKPVFEIINEGTPHEPSYRSTVILNNVRYDSLPGFSSRKEAEHSAAEVALIVLANSPDVRFGVSQTLLKTSLCKSRLSDYSQRMNHTVPLYKCHDEQGIWHCVVEIGGIKYNGASARTKKEAEVNAARTALVAIESAASVSEDHIRNSIFTVVPQKKKVSDPGISTQAAGALEPEKGLVKMDCSSQGTTDAGLEVKMDCPSQGTTDAGLEVKLDGEAAVELGITNNISTQHSTIDRAEHAGAVEGPIMQEKAAGGSSEVNIDNNQASIDSGFGMVGISTNETDAALKPSKSQLKRLRKKRKHALMMNCSALGTVGAGLVVNMEDQAAVESAITDAVKNHAVDDLKINTAGQAGVVVGVRDAISSHVKSTVDSNIDSQVLIRPKKRQKRKHALKMESSAQGTMGAGLNVGIDGGAAVESPTIEAISSQYQIADGLEVNIVGQAGVVVGVMDPFSSVSQVKSAGGSDIDNQAAIGSSANNVSCQLGADSGPGLVGISAQQTGAALEPKNGLVKMDCSSQGTTDSGLEVKMDGQAAVGLRITNDFSTQHSTVDRAGQAGVVGGLTQEKAAGGSSEVKIDNQMAIDSGIEVVRISAHETDAPLKPSKGQLKRMRKKTKCALKMDSLALGKTGAELVVNNTEGQAAVESALTDTVKNHAVNDLKINTAGQAGVVVGVMDALSSHVKSTVDSSIGSQVAIGPKKRQKRKHALKMESLAQGTMGAGLNVDIDGWATVGSPTIEAINSQHQIGDDLEVNLVGQAGVVVGVTNPISSQSQVKSAGGSNIDNQAAIGLCANNVSCQLGADSGFRLVGISTQQTGAAVEPEKGQSKKRQKKKKHAQEMHCSAQGTACAGLDVNVESRINDAVSSQHGLGVDLAAQAGVVVGVTDSNVDIKAAIGSNTNSFSKQGVDSGLGHVGISAQQTDGAMEPEKGHMKKRRKKKHALKGDFSAQGTPYAGLDVSVDGWAAVESGIPNVISS